MLNRIFWALTGTFLPIDKYSPESIAEAGLFLLRQKARMPDYISRLTGIATTVFGLGSVPLYGRPFFNLNLAQRKAYIALWASSPLPPLRDYIRLIQSLVVLRAHEYRTPSR